MTPFKSLEQCVQGGKSETFLYALNTCEQIQTYKQWLQFALCQTIREELTIVIPRLTSTKDNRWTRRFLKYPWNIF